MNLTEVNKRPPPKITFTLKLNFLSTGRKFNKVRITGFALNQIDPLHLSLFNKMSLSKAPEARRCEAKLKIGDKEGGCLDLSKGGELGCGWAYDSIREYCQ